MTTIPTITIQDIHDYVGDASFQRAQSYFSGDAIYNTRRQSMSLKARCQGSQPSAYHVQVTFDSEGIANSNCTCPLGSRCKHVAALLLTWLQNPGEFLEQQEVDAVLEQCSKPELISLIKKMLRRDPDLEMLLPITGKQQMTVNIEQYRRQISKAFRRSSRDWEDYYGLPDEIFDIRDAADELAQHEDYASAVSIYEPLVTEVLEQTDEYDDETGELSGFIAECLDELDTYLDKVQDDKALREQILHILFAAYSHDIEAGGVGIAEEAPDMLLKHTTAEERQAIIGWIGDALSKNKTGYDSNWRREHYGSLLLDLQGDSIDDETFLRICRETGRIPDLVDRLLKLGRVDEAIKATAQVTDYDLIDLANLFIQLGHDAIAEQLIQQRSKKSPDIRLVEWLKQRYLARNDQAAALTLAEQLFRTRPSLGEYQEIRQLARQFGQWETKRSELIAFLHKNAPQNTYLLIKIALDEGEIDQALDLLKSSNQQSTYSYGSLSYPGAALEVAQAAEETRPREAIAIYQQQVEKLIAQRGRESYQVACRHLLKIRALYEKLDESEQWASYITGLRDSNRGLRALKDELASAGL